MIREGWTAEKAIERAQTSDDPSLGVTDEEAQHCVDLLLQSGLEDVAACIAFDDFNRRATFGRAW